MKRKKLLLSESGIIDLIASTVMEAMEDAVNPIETGELDDGNHYLNSVPDKGFQKFWDDWEEVDQGNISEEDFKITHKKTRDQYKEDIKDEIDSAANDARDYYKSYYSKDNPDVFKKLIEPTLDKHSIPRIRINYIHTMLDKIADGGWSWTHRPMYDTQGKTHRGGTNIWYSCEELKKAHPTTTSCDSWGWVNEMKTGRYTYNMNVYKFSNPTLAGWRHAIYSTTVHEIGHLMTRFLDDLGVEAYPGAHTADDTIEKGGVQSGNKAVARDTDYPLNPWESYARIHQLRRIFDVKSNISSEEWANIFMDKVNSGDITFEIGGVEEAIDLDRNKRKKDLTCGQKFSYEELQDNGTKLLVARADKIQQYLIDRGFKIDADSGFGNKTAKAVAGYLGLRALGIDDEESLRKYMVKKYPIFSDGIGKQSQGIIADLLYEKCLYRKKEAMKTWIPPVTFELYEGDKVVIILSKQLLTQQYSGKHGNADGVPDTYDNLWHITADIRFNGRRYDDISALFAKFSLDLRDFTPSKGASKDNVYVIIDFEKIEEVNDIFVKEDFKDEFDDLYHPADSSDT